MKKYRITQDHDQHLRLSLTPLGLAREFAGGVALALPVCVAGIAAFFLPDYVGIYQHKEGADVWLFWWSLVGLLAVIVACYGARRATRVAFWEMDGQSGRVRMQTRTLFGGVGELFEAGVDEVQELRVKDGDVVIRILEAPELTIARAWFGRGEIEEIARRSREALGSG